MKIIARFFVLLQRKNKNRHYLMTFSDKSIWVGLSGGPDSVAVLLWLIEQGYTARLHAAHCNFQLREQESERDERFCRDLCERLHIPLEVRRFDTRAYMESHHLSLEMAARELRYHWWKDLDGIIALGHHQDDSIETMLMNLMRGTGIHGMTGIVEYNAAARTWRPLIRWTKSEVLDFLQANNQDYIIDSSNLESDILRNKIRNQLIPLMEQINPNARQGMATTMHHLSETAAVADGSLDRFFETYVTEREADGSRWLDFEFKRWSREYVARNNTKNASPEYEVQCFDADKLALPLTVRRWQEGDRISPLGMQGHTKLLSDLFTNAHYTPMQKASTWVVVDANGMILWVPGLRVCEEAKITPSTRSVVSIKMKR